MGTRNVIQVVCDGETKVSQYGQWDGYPEGQGSDVFEFLKENKDKLNAFLGRVRALIEIGEESYKAKWVECGAKPDEDWVSTKVSDVFEKRYPHLSRNCGAKVLQLIQDGVVTEVALDKVFVNNSLFCEWAYVIDLDKLTFEVYEGYQKEPHRAGRFSKEEPNEGGYYPVKHVCTFDLGALPDTKEEFVSVVESFLPDEEE